MRNDNIKTYHHQHDHYPVIILPQYVVHIGMVYFGIFDKNSKLNSRLSAGYAYYTGFFARVEY
jgi:hypothetical protein